MKAIARTRKTAPTLRRIPFTFFSLFLFSEFSLRFRYSSSLSNFPPSISTEEKLCGTPRIFHKPESRNPKSNESSVNWKVCMRLRKIRKSRKNAGISIAIFVCRIPVRSRLPGESQVYSENTFTSYGDSARPGMVTEPFCLKRQNRRNLRQIRRKIGRTIICVTASRIFYLRQTVRHAFPRGHLLRWHISCCFF